MDVRPLKREEGRKEEIRKRERQRVGRRGETPIVKSKIAVTSV